MKNAKYSFILLIATGFLFCVGVFFTEVDSPKRWGLLIICLLGVPASFFWGGYSLMKEKDKISRYICITTLTISGAIMILGICKLF